VKKQLSSLIVNQAPKEDKTFTFDRQSEFEHQNRRVIMSRSPTFYEQGRLKTIGGPLVCYFIPFGIEVKTTWSFFGFFSLLFSIYSLCLHFLAIEISNISCS